MSGQRSSGWVASPRRATVRGRPTSQVARARGAALKPPATARSAPPDAPAEHRLEALPEPLASYAAELRERGLSGLPMEESARIESLRACCLRLRKRELDRALPGLRYLMLEADAEAQLDYMAKVNELTQRLNALTQLIVPLGERQVGKIDGAVKRDA